MGQLFNEVHSKLISTPSTHNSVVFSAYIYDYAKTEEEALAADSDIMYLRNLNVEVEPFRLWQVVSINADALTGVFSIGFVRRVPTLLSNEVIATMDPFGLFKERLGI